VIAREARGKARTMLGDPTHGIIWLPFETCLSSLLFSQLVSISHQLYQAA